MAALLNRQKPWLRGGGQGRAGRQQEAAIQVHTTQALCSPALLLEGNCGCGGSVSWRRFSECALMQRSI